MRRRNSTIGAWRSLAGRSKRKMPNRINIGEEFLTETEMLSDSERGRLVVDLIRYCVYGEIPDFKGNERFVWKRCKKRVDADLRKQGELKSGGRDLLSEQFETFYAAYPRKQGKKDALRAFQALAPDDDTYAEIMDGLNRRIQSKEWKLGGQQFIPLPATFIRGERWKDENVEVGFNKPYQRGIDDYKQNKVSDDDFKGICIDLNTEGRNSE
jgi:hypothetical protein